MEIQNYEALNILSLVSVIIPTRDRPKDLAELLLTILYQSFSRFEVIIVDDSPMHSAKQLVDSFSSRFNSISKLNYIEGDGEGLPAARNLGIKNSKGDYILFLDDDTLLDRDTISTLAAFHRDNPLVLGVQPKIFSSSKNPGNGRLVKMFENALHKVLMLSYLEENKLAVRRSGASVFPNNLTKVISTQRLSGCCCYRREIFNELSFDTNLKRGGYMEDLDFSYRIYLRKPKSLYIIPYTKITHKISVVARLPTKLSIYMMTIYWFYVFFKDVLKGSIINLIAFLWALTGNLIVNTIGLIIKKKSKLEWWRLIYLLGSYITAFRNLKNIRMQRLEFFNKNLE